MINDNNINSEKLYLETIIKGAQERLEELTNEETEIIDGGSGLYPISPVRTERYKIMGYSISIPLSRYNGTYYRYKIRKRKFTMQKIWIKFYYFNYEA